MNYRIGLIGLMMVFVWMVVSCAGKDSSLHDPTVHDHSEVTTQGVIQSYSISNVQNSFYANVLNDNQTCTINCGTTVQSSWRNINSVDDTTINNAWYTSNLYPMKAVLNLGSSKTLEKLEFFIGNNNPTSKLDIRIAATQAGLANATATTFSLPANSYNTWQSKAVGLTGQFIELRFPDSSSRFNLTEVRVTVVSGGGSPGGGTVGGTGVYGALTSCRPGSGVPCSDLPTRAVSSNSYQRLRDGNDHPDASNRWYPSARTSAGVATTTAAVLTACRVLHDRFWVTGPDDKAYPTWHPPTYPITVSGANYSCLFGHEHGDNPWESVFYQQRASGQAYNAQWNAKLLPIPFGYANQVQHNTTSDTKQHRHEDHVGHKVFWEKFELAYGNGSGMGHIVPTGQVGSKIICDALLKIHFGTHSNDAFANHQHEMVSHLNCKDAAGKETARFHLTVLSPLAKPGFFSDECSGVLNSGGNTLNNTDSRTKAVPMIPTLIGNLFSDNTTAQANIYSGERVIPDWDCVRSWAPSAGGSTDDIRKKIGQHMMEIWTTPTIITNAANTGTLVQFTPYISVLNPARVHYRNSDGSIALRYSIDACKPGFTNSPGSSGPAQLTEYCNTVNSLGITDWKDLRSPFNGTFRNVNFKGAVVSNSTGSTAVYTNSFGRTVSNTGSRATSVQQYVMIGDNGQFSGPNAQVNNDNDNIGRGASYPVTGSNKVCSLTDSNRPVTCKWDGATVYTDKGEFGNTTVPVTLSTPLQYYRQQFALEWERDYMNSSYARPHNTFADGVRAPN